MGVNRAVISPFWLVGRTDVQQSPLRVRLFRSRAAGLLAALEVLLAGHFLCFWVVVPPETHLLETRRVYGVGLKPPKNKGRKKKEGTAPPGANPSRSPPEEGAPVGSSASASGDRGLGVPAAGSAAVRPPEEKHQERRSRKRSSSRSASRRSGGSGRGRSRSRSGSRKRSRTPSAGAAAGRFSRPATGTASRKKSPKKTESLQLGRCIAIASSLKYTCHDGATSLDARCKDWFKKTSVNDKHGLVLRGIEFAQNELLGKKGKDPHGGDKNPEFEEKALEQVEAVASSPAYHIDKMPESQAYHRVAKFWSAAFGSKAFRWIYLLKSDYQCNVVDRQEFERHECKDVLKIYGTKTHGYSDEKARERRDKVKWFVEKVIRPLEDTFRDRLQKKRLEQLEQRNQQAQQSAAGTAPGAEDEAETGTDSDEEIKEDVDVEEEMYLNEDQVARAQKWKKLMETKKQLISVAKERAKQTSKKLDETALEQGISAADEERKRIAADQGEKGLSKKYENSKIEHAQASRAFYRMIRRARTEHQRSVKGIAKDLKKTGRDMKNAEQLANYLQTKLLSGSGAAAVEDAIDLGGRQFANEYGKAHMLPHFLQVVSSSGCDALTLAIEGRPAGAGDWCEPFLKTKLLQDRLKEIPSCRIFVSSVEFANLFRVPTLPDRGDGSDSKTAREDDDHARRNFDFPTSAASGKEKDVEFSKCLVYAYRGLLSVYDASIQAVEAADVSMMDTALQYLGTQLELLKREMSANDHRRNFDVTGLVARLKQAARTDPLVAVVEQSIQRWKTERTKWKKTLFSLFLNRDENDQHFLDKASEIFARLPSKAGWQTRKVNEVSSDGEDRAFVYNKWMQKVLGYDPSMNPARAAETNAVPAESLLIEFLEPSTDEHYGSFTVLTDDGTAYRYAQTVRIGEQEHVDKFHQRFIDEKNLFADLRTDAVRYSLGANIRSTIFREGIAPEMQIGRTTSSEVSVEGGALQLGKSSRRTFSWESDAFLPGILGGSEAAEDAPSFFSLLQGRMLPLPLVEQMSKDILFGQSVSPELVDEFEEMLWGKEKDRRPEPQHYLEFCSTVRDQQQQVEAGNGCARPALQVTHLQARIYSFTRTAFAQQMGLISLKHEFPPESDYTCPQYFSDEEHERLLGTRERFQGLEHTERIQQLIADKTQIGAQQLRAHCLQYAYRGAIAAYRTTIKWFRKFLRHSTDANQKAEYFEAALQELESWGRKNVPAWRKFLIGYVTQPPEVESNEKYLANLRQEADDRARFYYVWRSGVEMMDARDTDQLAKSDGETTRAEQGVPAAPRQEERDLLYQRKTQRLIDSINVPNPLPEDAPFARSAMHGFGPAPAGRSDSKSGVTDAEKAELAEALRFSVGSNVVDRKFNLGLGLPPVSCRKFYLLYKQGAEPTGPFPDAAPWDEFSKNVSAERRATDAAPDTPLVSMELFQEMSKDILFGADMMLSTRFLAKARLSKIFGSSDQGVEADGRPWYLRSAGDGAADVEVGPGHP
ncbi:unnamed protein product [Amoebophrya sp. A120]|nr:unnamed protein product [Amoebophrya sp. A120]|eukprot:GSA120T00003964001.1